MGTFEEEACYPVLATTLQRGSDFAELFLEDRNETHISGTGDRVASASSVHMRGAGLYLLNGLESRYAYTNDTSAQGVGALSDDISSALAWAHPAPSREAAPLRDLEIPSPVNAIVEDPLTVSMKDKCAVIQDICRRARGYDSRIVSAQVDYKERVQTVAVVNTEGLWRKERRVVIAVQLNVAAHDGEHTQTNWSNYSFAAGFECLRDEDLHQTIAEQVCGSAITALSARPVTPDFMPVVVDSGTFIHEDCGHPLETAALAGGSSVFSGKFGQQVASPLVTIADDGTIPGLCGSAAMSDEGENSAPNVLIEEGILRGCMADRLGARAMGADVAQTGAGRRQDYRFAPTSRMTNTYMHVGTTPTESIIPSVSHGLYVSDCGGGNINPATGRFNFLAVSGYMIENGELTWPIANINLSGQSIDALMRIAAVGDTYITDPGSLCGAGSGLVYVTAFMPRVLIDGLMVG